MVPTFLTLLTVKWNISNSNQHCCRPLHGVLQEYWALSTYATFWQAGRLKTWQCLALWTLVPLRGDAGPGALSDALDLFCSGVPKACVRVRRKPNEKQSSCCRMKKLNSGKDWIHWAIEIGKIVKNYLLSKLTICIRVISQHEAKSLTALLHSTDDVLLERTLTIIGDCGTFQQNQVCIRQLFCAFKKMLNYDYFRTHYGKLAACSAY